jgi:hypothetical protein
MPIADPFAPAAESGGTGTEDLGWEVVDVSDGSWTFANPSGYGVVSYSTDPAGNTKLEWDVAAPVSDDLLTNGANFVGPRLYKQILKPDGTPYRLDDTDQNILIVINIDRQIRPADTAGQNNPLLHAVLGLAEDPTQTIRTNLKLAGVGFGFNGTLSNRNLIPYTIGSNNLISPPDYRVAMGDYWIWGKAGGAVNATALRDNGTTQQLSSRNTNQFYTENGEIYLCLGWSPSLIGQSSSGELQGRIRYKIISFANTTT